MNTELDNHQSLSTYFSVLREKTVEAEAPDYKDEEVLAVVGKTFMRDFVDADISIAMKSVGDILASRVINIPFELTRSILLDFGVQVTPFLQELYPDVHEKSPNELAGRISHTIVHAQTIVQQTQTERGRLMTLGQRTQMHAQFSEKLKKSEIVLTDVS